jgi:hypothetical protein
MVDNLTMLGLMYQKHLPLEMLATYGTSPQILAPLFNLFCIALVCLALLYLIFSIANNQPRNGYGFNMFVPSWLYTSRTVFDPQPICPVYTHRTVPSIFNSQSYHHGHRSVERTVGTSSSIFPSQPFHGHGSHLGSQRNTHSHRSGEASGPSSYQSTHIHQHR